MNYTNIQLTSLEAGPDETVLQVVENAGNAKIKGAELDMAARPVPALELNLSGGYLDAKYTELNPGVTYVTLSSQFTKAPRWSGTTGAQYTWNLFNRSINARLDYSYSSRTYNDPENTPVLVQGGYGVLAARTTWHSKSAAPPENRSSASFSITSCTTSKISSRGVSVERMSLRQA